MDSSNYEEIKICTSQVQPLNNIVMYIPLQACVYLFSAALSRPLYCKVYVKVYTKGLKES